MLILSRKPGETIVIDGRIRIKIVRVEGDVVKVGIEAPIDLPVHRLEVYEEIQRSNQQALTRPQAPLPKLPFRKTAAPTPAPTCLARSGPPAPAQNFGPNTRD